MTNCGCDGPSEAQAAGMDLHCTKCGCVVNDDDFDNEAAAIEFERTGTCQECYEAVLASNGE